MEGATLSAEDLISPLDKFLQGHPVVLSPVCCERPWVVDEDITRVGEIATAMRMVMPVNILGLPSCAVPVGSDEGLPQGVQLIGARFREDDRLSSWMLRPWF